jgi:hypothetical protein
MLRRRQKQEYACYVQQDTTLQAKIKVHVTPAHQAHFLLIKVKQGAAAHVHWANFRRHLHQLFAQSVQLVIMLTMKVQANAHRAAMEHGAMKRQKNLDAKIYALQAMDGTVEAGQLHAGFAKEGM